MSSAPVKDDMLSLFSDVSPNVIKTQELLSPILRKSSIRGSSSFALLVLEELGKD
jgi:hypothetical protein